MREMNEVKAMSLEETGKVAGGLKWYTCRHCGSSYLTKACYYLHVIFNRKKLGCTNDYMITR